MRFLHLADVHLDTLFAGRSDEVRDRLREASREAFRRGISLAIEQRVDAVLVAGDLFDGSRLSYPTERFLLTEISRLGQVDIPFLYATGNHDPGEGLAGSGRIGWPDHVELFSGAAPRTVQVLRDGSPVGTVTAAGHEHGRVGEDLSLAFPDPGPAGARSPAVAMLHTQVTGAGGAANHDRYAPSELPRLRSAGYDYWALGHIHLREALEELPGIHYPGNPQGRHPRESGARGGLLVEIPAAGAGPTVEFVPLAPIRWETLRIDALETVARFDGLAERIEERWRERRDEARARPDTRWMVRVELGGASPLAAELTRGESRRGFSAELAGRLDVLEVELRTAGVRSTVDPADYRDRNDPVGTALRHLEGLDSPEAGERLSPEVGARVDEGARLLEHLGIEPEELAGLGHRDHGDAGRYLHRILGDGVGAGILIEHFRSEGEES